MTPDEMRLYRQMRVALSITIVLFSVIAWATAQVEGVNAAVVALVAVAGGALGGLLWITFRWKATAVMAVTAAIVLGGVIGAVRFGDQPSEAHTIKCPRPAASADAQQQAIYRTCMIVAIEHALWHAQHDTTVAVARDMSGEKHVWVTNGSRVLLRCVWWWSCTPSAG